MTHALVNEENVKTMTKDLLNFLLVAEQDFKDDLVPAPGRETAVP